MSVPASAPTETRSLAILTGSPLTPAIKDQLEVFFAECYGAIGKYVGEKQFRESTLVNATHIFLHLTGEVLESAAILNCRRVIAIGTAPSLGGGRVRALHTLSRSLAREVPGYFITISTCEASRPMLKSMFSCGPTFTVVDTTTELRALLKNTQNIGPLAKIDGKTVELSMSKKEEQAQLFFATSRPDSFHGPDYWQVTVLHQP